MIFSSQHMAASYKNLKLRSWIVVILVISGIVVLGSLVFKDRKDESVVKLRASVSYEDKKLEIINRDSIDFVHADLSINEYYKIRDVNLKMGEPYTIWLVEFMHHNGTRFPLNQNPVEFSIWCELNHDKNGYYYKSFK